MTKEEAINQISAFRDAKRNVHKFVNQVISPSVEHWKGKVYNKRFRDAVNEFAEAYNVRVYFEEFVGQNKHVLRLYIVERNKSTYIFTAEFYYKILLGEGKRIQGGDDEFNQSQEDAYVSGMQDIKDIIEEYDYYLEKAIKLRDDIKEYGDLSYVFRSTIPANFFKTYLL